MKQHFNILSKFQSKLQVKLRGTNFSSSNLDAAPRDDTLPISDDDADKSLVLQVCHNSSNSFSFLAAYGCCAYPRGWLCTPKHGRAKRWLLVLSVR